MKLDEFITETLLNVRKGIHDANTQIKRDNPSSDVPNCYFLRPGSAQENGAGIEFDVAVTTKLEGDGKAGGRVSLSVVEATFGSGGAVSKESASRIRFVVTIGNWIG